VVISIFDELIISIFRVGHSMTLVTIYKTRLQHNLEDRNPKFHNREDPELYISLIDIRYCAFLSGSSWSDLLVFAGTVFQQILVWAPTSQEKETVDSPVLHTLKGHDVCQLFLLNGLLKIFSNNIGFVYLKNSDQKPRYLEELTCKA
jgi:hypothetical protein